MAHPGHELLLYGWLAQTKPVVHVITDGSGRHSSSRLAATSALLRSVGASAGTIFGALTDRDAYSMLLRCDAEKLFELVSHLAADLNRDRPQIVVTDAAEGYNPVHDLCRLIGGAAIEIADSGAVHYEYSVVEHPAAHGGTMTIDLDDDQHATKIGEARRFAPLIPDIDELLSEYGTDAYRREMLRPVEDWTRVDMTATPDYERFGRERGYAQVIRRDEHFLPLRDALCAQLSKRSCVF